MSKHIEQKNDHFIDEYEAPDEVYKKIIKQIDDEERLWSLFLEMREFAEYSTVPLLQRLNIENLSEFVNPERVRIF